MKTDHELFLDAIKALEDRRFGPAYITRYSTGEFHTHIGQKFPQILNFQYDEHANKAYYVKQRKAA